MPRFSTPTPPDFLPGTWLDTGSLVRWAGDGTPFAFLVKELGSQRDLRDALMSLAYVVSHHPLLTSGLLVVLGDKMTTSRFEMELALFESVTRPEVFNRLAVVKAHKTPKRFTIKAALGQPPEVALRWLANCQIQPKVLKPKPRPMVLTALAHHGLTTSEPQLLSDIASRSGASYPSVKSCIKDLASRGLMAPSGARGVKLRALTPVEWMHLARDRNELDQVSYYRDASGIRTAHNLLERLSRRANQPLPHAVRVGGVFGALDHDPAVDLTGSPRLDLHSSWPPDALASFLDAGLDACNQNHPQCVLAIHSSANGLAKDAAPRGELQSATALECLADLLALGYIPQANELARNLSAKQEATQAI